MVLTRVGARPYGWGTGAPYTLAMSIDREAWAAVVAKLLQDEADGNQTHFAAIVGADRKTVARWLAGTVDVSEEKLRSVARNLGISARDLLLRVGYYQADELPTEDNPAIADTNDAIELVRKSDLSPSAKRELIAHLTAQLEEYRRQQVAEATRLIELAKRQRPRRAG